METARTLRRAKSARAEHTIGCMRSTGGLWLSKPAYPVKRKRSRPSEIQDFAVDDAGTSVALTCLVTRPPPKICSLAADTIRPYIHVAMTPPSARTEKRA